MKCVLNKRLLHFLTVSGSPCSMAQSTWQCHPPHDKPSYFCLLRPYYQARGNYCTTKALLHRGHWSVLCQHPPRACFFHLFFHTALGSLWRTTQPCSPQFSSHPPGADHVPALVTISPVSVPCSAEISIFSGFQFLQNIYWHTGQHSALLFITCTAAVGKSNLKKAHLAGTRETSWWS